MTSAARTPSAVILSQDSRRLKEKEKEVEDFVTFDINSHKRARSSDSEDEGAEFYEYLMQKILN